ncbi:regulatory protein RecX [uncultured Algibacter sp.]|uniref:regulatory protein RecX n=1 Tax=uncultured Algibacter sp. TaxID=298659 RepID=UPI0026054033|nr:regulatory protein RecX [uncultured Algibacter sp.]
MMNKKTYTVQEATKKMEHYCAYQERCHQEVRQKLEAMSMIPEAIDMIMVHLLEHNYLNEARFAETFVRGKFRIKHWGRQRLRIELKKRDISNININHALAEIDDAQYLVVFSELAQKKAHSLKESNVFKRRKKFIDYFLYRGWESHFVYEKAYELIK